MISKTNVFLPKNVKGNNETPGLQSLLTRKIIIVFTANFMILHLWFWLGFDGENTKHYHQTAGNENTLDCYSDWKINTVQHSLWLPCDFPHINLWRGTAGREPGSNGGHNILQYKKHTDGNH